MNVKYLQQDEFKELTDALLVARGLLACESRAHKERGEPLKAEPLDGFLDVLSDLLAKLGVEP